MAKDRNSVCMHYICKGECAISNKTCTVRNEMQHCPMYEAANKGKPVYSDRREKRREKERQRRNSDWEE